ncbi:MAG: hypothetical protein U0791_20800 [Gemmataceae bacterium]
MNVPLHVKRRFEPADSADALLFRAASFAPLLTAIRIAPGAKVLPVHGGFVLLTSDGIREFVPGAIRLRRIGGDLFVPHDAILVPALLPDEVASLTRDRGLVVLPDGGILAFDPGAPLPVSRWLVMPVRRGTWEPLPPAPELANDLRNIEFPAPPAAAMEILTEGQPDGAEAMPTDGPPRESNRPASGSALGRAAGAVGMAAGGMLSWLGRNLGMPGFAKAGANLIRRAVERVPRLTERIFGEQEAALRDVLRELQEGDVENALRRAPPAVSDPDAPARVDSGSSLGFRDPRYSLRDLIGGSGQGGWLGGGDVWTKLADEYRRLAREAIARGDFRRAAYLHGMLLKDYRAAANALLAGGLHRDAAILLRDKVKDELAAARAFDQAGDFDEALRLYDRHHRHEEAGDLLKRLDDLPRARERYLRAADVLAGRQEWHAAGDFVWCKLGDRAEACRYFGEGWRADRGEALVCGQRLFAEHAASNDLHRTRELFGDAESRFAPPRTKDARIFFHQALRVAPAELRDDFADRARLLFAEHLRPAKEQGRGESLARDLFPPGLSWPPAVARDAAFAAGSSRRKAAEVAIPPPKDVVPGTVRAVGYAKETGSLVIASDDELTLWSASRGRIKLCGLAGTAVFGVAIAPEARRIFLLHADRRGNVELSAFTEVGTIFQLEHHTFDASADGDWHLEPRPLSTVTVATPRRREQFLDAHLNSAPPAGYLESGSNTHLLACVDSTHYWDWDDRFIRCLDEKGNVRLRWVPHWTPAVPRVSSLTMPPLDWSMPHPGCLEVTGVDADGVLHWSRFSLNSDPSSFDTDGERHVFRAVCQVSAGSVIGATDENKLFWVRHRMMVELKFTDDAFRSIPARIVALFATGHDKEILVVFEDGSIVPIRDWH